jgi:hypothetical protein
MVPLEKNIPIAAGVTAPGVISWGFEAPPALAAFDGLIGGPRMEPGHLRNSRALACSIADECVGSHENPFGNRAMETGGIMSHTRAESTRATYILLPTRGCSRDSRACRWAEEYEHYSRSK